MGLTKVTRGVIEPFENYDVNNINATGIVTATSFDGIVQSSSLTGALPALDGSALTGVVGSGSGIVIENNGTPVGTAGTVNFDSNLNVSFGAGTATVTIGDTDLSIADKIVHTGDTDTAIRFPAADTFTVETAGEERLRVKSGGNVGIGTDDPQQLLHLASTNPRIRIDDTDSGGYYTELRQGGSATYLQLDGNNIGSGNFRITTDGGSEIFRFNDKGNVTIEGSTTSFDINPTLAGLQLYYETDTQLATIASYDGTSGSEISIGTNDGTGDVVEAIRIDSSGNIGIGTDNPTEKLHVLGDARITGILTVGTASITIDGDGGTITATTFSGTATNLSDAANITTGTLADARIPSLDASKITAGTFSSSRIPSLDASKITSGSFGTGRIPNLSAAKITSGTLNVNITASRVTDEVATSTAGTKGSYAFLGQTTNTARSPNYTVAGSSLLYANANGPESGSPGGSWRLMGRLGSGEDQEKASVWVRYA